MDAGGRQNERKLTAPVAAVRRAEEEILKDDGHKIPQDDLAAEHGLIKGGNLAGGLTVVVGKSKEQKQSNGTEEDRNRVTDGTRGVSVRKIGGRSGIGVTHVIFQELAMLFVVVSSPSLDALVSVEPQYHSAMM